MKKYLPRLAVVAAALTCISGAQALVLTFDEAIDTTYAPFAPLLSHLDEIQTQGFWIDAYSTKGQAGAGDLVGALVEGGDVANVCAGLVCPGGNSSRYLLGLNDGLPDIGRLDGKTFSVTGFDASFVAAAGDPVLSTSLLLRVEGYSTAALLFQQDFYLPGPVAGAYSFASYALSAENAAVQVNDVAFRVYACTTPSTCSRALNKAQFALDNLDTVTAVPEPSQWLLMGLGLAAVGALVRRRSAAA